MGFLFLQKSGIINILCFKGAFALLPEGFLNRMKPLLGAEFDTFCASYDRPRNAGLRRNPLAAAQPPLPEFGLSPVPWCAEGFYYDPATRPGLSPLHAAGAYYLQEPSAMAPVELLDPQPGERVLDLCAAPGGKSTQIAGKLAGHGLLVCNEINEKRARVLAGNIERLGVATALVLCEHPKRLAERFPAYFDRILVDAPCSGEGMFRKEQAAVDDWTEDTNAICANRQTEILQSAAGMLRPGGRLVYSTCTFSPLENEGVISAFLKTHPEFTLLPAARPPFSPGRPDWIAAPAPGLEQTVRLWPHKLRGEGHFAAVLQRGGDAPGSELPIEPGMKAPKELLEFAKAVELSLPEGNVVSFGQTIYLAPEELPALRGLRVLRCGLELGEVRKNRVEPAHALALWLRRCAATLNFDRGDARLAQYLAGQTIPTDGAGWMLVQVEGCSLGWGKASAGQLKNHYPKALRRPL